MIKKNIHPAWKILVVLCLIMAGTYGIILNSVGLLLNAIMTDMGFTGAQISMYHTIRQVTIAIFLIPTFNFYQRCKRGNLCISFYIAAIIGSYAITGLYVTLWQFYISAFLQGVFASCLYTLIPVTANNWFKKSNGVAIGITMATSGFISIFSSPIVSSVIEAFGWRKATFIIAGVSALIAIPATLLFFYNEPATMGVRQYGAEEDGPGLGIKNAASSASSAITGSKSMFIVCMLFCCCYSSYNIMMHQMALYGKSLGMDLTASAFLTSAMMVGNIGGKLVSGYVSDRFGAFKMETLLVGSGIVALTLLLFGKASNSIALAGALVIGIQYSASSALSLFTLRIYGPTEYKSRLTKFQSVGNLLSAFGATLIGIALDVFGSFDVYFIICICFCIVQLVMIAWVSKTMKAIEAAN